MSVIIHPLWDFYGSINLFIYLSVDLFTLKLSVTVD